MGLAVLGTAASIELVACEGCEVPAVPGQEPPCGFTCPAGQALTCSEICVTPVPNDGPCSILDCTSNSVCQSGLGCVPADSGYKCVGTAAEGGLALLSECDPTASVDLCPADTFCKNMPACFSDYGGAAVCSRGVTHGGKCDSEWADIVPGCDPCIMGLKCVADFCHRPCQSVDACPCPDTLHEFGCVPIPGDSSGHKACYECRHIDENCDNERRCCDAGTHCSEKDGTCCVDEGTACKSSAECCEADEDICLAGTCRPCIGLGKTGCTQDSDCCKGKICKSSTGMCVKPCTPKECKISNLKGPCKESVSVCDEKGEESCPQKTFETTEQCNKIDDDCNGKVDDIEAKECKNDGKTIPGCPPDFKATGVKVCKDGKDECDFSDRFCGGDIGTQCGGTTVDGKFCGSCGNTPCGCPEDEPSCAKPTLCMPGLACLSKSVPFPEDTICCDYPDCKNVTCWNPDQIGSCDPPDSIFVCAPWW